MLEWWVHSTAKPTNHRSKVGPFLSVIEAAQYTQEYRPAEQWKKISITGRTANYFRLWTILGDTPVNEAEEIEIDFLNFPKGTHRETIWHWFEETFNVVINDKMELENA
jgi:hypothetical protein